MHPAGKTDLGWWWKCRDLVCWAGGSRAQTRSRAGSVCEVSAATHLWGEGSTAAVQERCVPRPKTRGASPMVWLPVILPFSLSLISSKFSGQSPIFDHGDEGGRPLTSRPDSGAHREPFSACACQTACRAGR